MSSEERRDMVEFAMRLLLYIVSIVAVVSCCMTVNAVWR